MILIGGDSWGVGPCERNRNILHNGIAQMLKEQGQLTINLSQGGISNFDIADRIRGFVDANAVLIKEKLKCILIFQTEWNRDYSDIKLFAETNVYHQWNKNHSNLNFDYPLIAQQAISKFYYNLSSISKLCNAPVYIIGGCSDAIYLDKFSIEYPGVEVVCQSLVNLLVNNDHKIADPVYSFFSKAYKNLIVKIKKNSSNSSLEILLDDMDKGKDRLNLFKKHPEYFWPDGIHANQFGHKILFEFLQDKIPGLV